MFLDLNNIQILVTYRGIRKIGVTYSEDYL